ncbi:MAG: right-handed parallel beta-helix repeat-containing protein [Candidatus Bathyarchaeia archaeon]|jgi:parallel beta-helix repeat protein
MKQKVACVLMLVAFIFCILYAKPVDGQSQNNLVINVDGTVTPSTAPIQQEGGVYTLTEDFQGSILIQRSNTLFNGAGHSLQGYSVKLLEVTNVTIRDLAVSGLPHGSRYGIVLVDSTGCRVTNCTVTDVWSFLGLNGISYDGIYVNGGGSNVFTKNSLVNNSLGMHFESTDNNIITENSINYIKHSVDSSVSGIYFNNAHGNIIYHNNFNTKVGAQAAAYETSNIWDNGHPNGGNYWIDYQTKYPNAQQLNNSESYDTPYVINDQNQDRYPLLEPYSAKFPAIAVLSTVEIYNVSSVPLDFTVDKPVAWMGYSLDGTQNVTLSGNGTLTDVPNGVHTVTVYANDTFGNMGSETFRFTVAVPEAFPVAIVVAVLGVSAVAVGVGSIVYYKRRRR